MLKDYTTEALAWVNRTPASELNVRLVDGRLLFSFCDGLFSGPEAVGKRKLFAGFKAEYVNGVPLLQKTFTYPERKGWRNAVWRVVRDAFKNIDKHAPALLPTWDAASPDWQGLCLAVAKRSGLQVSDVSKLGLPMLAEAVADAAAQKSKAEAAAEPLSDTEQLAFDIISEQPDGKGIVAKDLLKAMRKRGVTITQDHLLGCVIPRLKACRGVKNRPGVGYYIPR